MSDFNQPTRTQNKQTPSVTPPSGQQTRQTDQGSIERNPDALTSRDGAEEGDREPSPENQDNKTAQNKARR